MKPPSTPATGSRRPSGLNESRTLSWPNDWVGALSVAQRPALFSSGRCRTSVGESCRKRVEIRYAAGIELSEGTAKSGHRPRVVAPARNLLKLPRRRCRTRCPEFDLRVVGRLRQETPGCRGERLSEDRPCQAMRARSKPVAPPATRGTACPPPASVTGPAVPGAALRFAWPRSHPNADLSIYAIRRPRTTSSVG